MTWNHNNQDTVQSLMFLCRDNMIANKDSIAPSTWKCPNSDNHFKILRIVIKTILEIWINTQHWITYMAHTEAHWRSRSQTFWSAECVHAKFSWSCKRRYLKFMMKNCYIAQFVETEVREMLHIPDMVRTAFFHFIVMALAWLDWTCVW